MVRAGLITARTKIPAKALRIFPDVTLALAIKHTTIEKVFEKSLGSP